MHQFIITHFKFNMCTQMPSCSATCNIHKPSFLNMNSVQLSLKTLLSTTKFNFDFLIILFLLIFISLVSQLYCIAPKRHIVIYLMLLPISLLHLEHLFTFSIHNWRTLSQPLPYFLVLTTAPFTLLFKMLPLQYEHSEKQVCCFSSMSHLVV